MRRTNRFKTGSVALVGVVTIIAASASLAFAQSSTPGADRTQNYNYNSNQPPGMNMNGFGNNMQGMQGGNSNYNGFNPQTGTWGGTSTTQQFNFTNGFNPQTGTWSGSSFGSSGGSSSNSGSGGSWSSMTGSNGMPTNVFTPNQAVSGASNSSTFMGNGNGNNKLNNGPKVIPHVTVRPKLSIYNRVPIRPRF